MQEGSGGNAQGRGRGAGRQKGKKGKRRKNLRAEPTGPGANRPRCAQMPLSPQAISQGFNAFHTLPGRFSAFQALCIICTKKHAESIRNDAKQCETLRGMKSIESVYQSNESMRNVVSPEETM